MSEHAHPTGGAWNLTRWEVPGCAACALPADDDAPDPLSMLITNYLRCYTLPANYGRPLYGQTHSDVAINCGPLLAEVIREHLDEAQR